MDTKEICYRIEKLEKKFDNHEREEMKKIDDMIATIHRNSEDIKSIVEETKSVVGLWRDLEGTARIGKTVQSFLVWVIKWGTIGVAIAATIKWLLGIKGA